MRQLIFFNSRDNLLRLDMERIAYFEADGNYTTIVTKNKLKVQVGISLSRMETALGEQLRENASIFMRIGKRFIINREFIFNIDCAHQRLVLTDMESFVYSLPISKDALKKMKDLLILSRV
ncbi:MAG: LytTR family transcriptional regulator [Prevotella sp.]|nr:LytTR family transcriptional regulator [Prevotella sp.]